MTDAPGIDPVPGAPSRIYPGFDVVRIVAALSVVFSHAFLLAETNEKREPFQYFTGEILGVYGVYVFFILSGFLVTDSALRSRNVLEFAIKRARRILPAFVIANLFMVLLVAPFFSSVGVLGFLTDSQTWRTLYRVMIFQETRLWFDTVSFYPGSNSAGVWLSHSVNGVLWTIRLEICCYITVALLMWARLLRPNVSVAIVCAGVIYAFQYELQPTGWGGMGLLFPSFAAGMAMRLHVANHVPLVRIAILSTLGLLLAMFVLPGWSALAAVLFPLFGCYPLLCFGVHGWRKKTVFGQGTDPSYGIYIWGWPVQQLLLAGASFAGLTGLSGPWFAVVSMPVAYMMGVISWHMIERPFLKGKGWQKPKLATAEADL